MTGQEKIPYNTMPRFPKGKHLENDKKTTHE